MSESLILADMSVLPFVLAGGVVLLIVCGLCVSIAILLAGFIKRKRNQRKKKRDEA